MFGRNLYEHKKEYPYCISAAIIVLIILVKIGSMEKFRDVNNHYILIRQD